MGIKDERGQALFRQMLPRCDVLIENGVLATIGRADLVGHPEYSDVLWRNNHQSELHAMIEAWTSAHDKFAVMEAMPSCRRVRPRSLTRGTLKAAPPLPHGAGRARRLQVPECSSMTR